MHPYSFNTLNYSQLSLSYIRDSNGKWRGLLYLYWEKELNNLTCVSSIWLDLNNISKCSQICQDKSAVKGQRSHYEHFSSNSPKIKRSELLSTFILELYTHSLWQLLTHLCLFLFPQRNFRRKTWNKVQSKSPEIWNGNFSVMRSFSDFFFSCWKRHRLDGDHCSKCIFLLWSFSPQMATQVWNMQILPRYYWDGTISLCLFSCWLRERICKRCYV